MITFLVQHVGYGEPETWEGIADDVLSSAGFDGDPVDAFDLAESCGLVVMPTATRVAHRMGSLLSVPWTGRRVWDHYQVAHEIGHWALERAHEPDSEEGADYLACALMLPRRRFEADLRATAWNPAALATLHPNAASSAIVRRIAMLRPALATVWDEAKLTRRIVGRGVLKSKVLLDEVRLAMRAFDTESVQAGENLEWAAPVFTPGRRRVVTVREAA